MYIMPLLTSMLFRVSIALGAPCSDIPASNSNGSKQGLETIQNFGDLIQFARDRAAQLAEKPIEVAEMEHLIQHSSRLAPNATTAEYPNTLLWSLWNREIPQNLLEKFLADRALRVSQETHYFWTSEDIALTQLRLLDALARLDLDAPKIQTDPSLRSVQEMIGTIRIELAKMNTSTLWFQKALFQFLLNRSPRAGFLYYIEFYKSLSIPNTLTGDIGLLRKVVSRRQAMDQIFVAQFKLTSEGGLVVDNSKWRLSEDEFATLLRILEVNLGKSLSVVSAPNVPRSGSLH